MELSNLSIKELLELQSKVKKNVQALNSGFVFAHLEPVKKIQKLLVDINEEINKRGQKTKKVSFGQALFQN